MLNEHQLVMTPDMTPISGLVKTKTGALVVEDTSAFVKYKREKELYKRVAQLENQVAALTQQIQDMIHG